MCQERCGPSQLRDPKRAPRRTPRPHPPSPTAANLRSGSESGSMAAKAKNDDEAPVLSEVEARGGVLVYFAIPLALGAVAIVLVLGLWNMVAGQRSARP